MPQSLTFIDCPACRKRIRSNAPECHHCHWRRRLPSSDVRAAEDASDDGMVPEAGYNSETDDFDYDEFIANELPQSGSKPKTKRWIWVTAWLLILATLLPYLVYLFV